MENKKTAVFGIYATSAQAERALEDLVRAGFPSADISVLLQDYRGTRDLAPQKRTKAPQSAMPGASAGTIPGGTLGVLAGTGAIAIPGLGPSIAAGPIMAALAGAGAGGVVGGITGALVGMGMTEYEAKRYEGRLKSGGVLLSCHCDTSNEIDHAREILKANGAEKVASSAESSRGVQTEKTRTSGSS